MIKGSLEAAKATGDLVVILRDATVVVWMPVFMDSVYGPQTFFSHLRSCDRTMRIAAVNAACKMVIMANRQFGPGAELGWVADENSVHRLGFADDHDYPRGTISPKEVWLE